MFQFYNKGVCLWTSTLFWFGFFDLLLSPSQNISVFFLRIPHFVVVHGHGLYFVGPLAWVSNCTFTPLLLFKS
jgi:hypothetical protein